MMPKITSLVFFDIETTGLPFQEKNQTKIIEFSLVAAHRKDLEATPYGQMPLVSKLTFLLNPERPICREVTKMTGLSRRTVADAPTFRQKISSIISFLESLPGPICLVAHNGNAFDFKILLAECNDASASLPSDLYCVDSLVGFRSILTGTDINYSNLESPVASTLNCNPAPIPKSIIDELMTDDEDETDEWPDLNLSNEEWLLIDEASMSMSFDSEVENRERNLGKKSDKRSAAIKKVFDEKSKKNNTRECLKLTSLFKRLLNRDQENAHRAEGDCLMLLQCVIALKEQFLPWADKNCKHLTEIQPLIRGTRSWRHHRSSR